MHRIGPITPKHGEEHRENRLGSDDIASKVEHSESSRLVGSAGTAARGTKLFDHTIDQITWSTRGVDQLVVEVHRLPLEGAELVEWLHLDPLDILHWRDEAGDLFD